MSKKVIIIFSCLIFLLGTLYTQEDEKLNNRFLKKFKSELLNEIFTINVGIMELREIGNIKEINPIDSQAVVNSIKSTLDKVQAAKLSKPAAVIKAAEVYTSKNTSKTNLITGEEYYTRDDLFIKKKLFFSQNIMDNNRLNELYNEFKKSDKFSPIAKPWIENYKNPFYVLNISKPFKRIIGKPDEICETEKVNNRGPIDLLIYGDIEKIDKYYIITLYFYSNLLKKELKELSFVSDSQSISDKTARTIDTFMPTLFNINYAKLNITTEEKDVRLFLDSQYLGRDNIKMDYLVPGNYVLTMSKKDYEDKFVNITLQAFEEKSLTLNMDKPKELQVVNFNIEPSGSKIYINSIYQGKTPFSLALPSGYYVISAKNPLYESYRYTLKIHEPLIEPSTIVYHLKSKDIKTYFKRNKMIYYATFWNFTFSLMATIPIIIFAYDFWNKYGSSIKTYTEIREYVNNLEDGHTEKYIVYGYDDYEEGKNKIQTMELFYGLSAAFITHTAISFGFLVFGLTNYLFSLEKKDFLPVIEYYNDLNGNESVTVGASIKF